LLVAILAAVPRRPDAEVTVECNPDDVTVAMLETFAAAGVDRVSIGVQSMVPEVLAALGRTHDPGNVERAVAAVRPAVVLHQATALSGLSGNPRRLAREVEPTNRLRTEGTRNLVGASERHGVNRIVAQSIAFVYVHEGPEVLTEEAPLDVDASGGWDAVARAVAVNEETVIGASGMVGVVLRYGQFYGPETGTFPEGVFAELLKRRRMPVIASGEGRFSFIHIDDAVSATLAAIERGSGIYNVVDDEPVRERDFAPGLAEALGAPAPRRIPAWVARLAAGQHAVRLMTTQRGASNRRAREELGWRPKYPSWREGVAAGSAQAAGTDSIDVMRLNAS
jgi:nucleoside-diphosphate-sugar epimerase